MGGEVFVGARWKDAKGVHEQCSLRWTNIMPRFMANPSFYKKGEAFEDFINRAKPANQWPQSRLTHEIAPSEYGVILFDFINKTVFSRQRYSGPGSICFHLSDDEDREQFLKMNAGKMITKVRGGLNPRSIRKLSVVVNACQKQGRGVQRPFAIVEYKIKNWTFDHKSEVGYDCWDEVRTFVKAAGWQSRIWTTKRAQENATIALAGIGVLKGKKR